ncbi:MAG: Rieske 2Fe-2S domain-containing protein, partial [Actinomycetota bacterium]|nr:Rieske 2Fe-2S domain-containing protein [Actinomycetota bacterium]
MSIYELTERLARLEKLDPIAKPIADAVGKLIPHGPFKDALSGTWLGHSLHPVLTDLPLGTWTSAMLLDLLGGEESARAAEILVGLGILSSLPTAASGLSDWSDTQSGEQRVGLLHAASNVAALGLFGGSYSARRRGNRRLGVLLGLAGGSVSVVGAYLGGHLTMGQGVGTNQTAFEEGFTEWTAVADQKDIVEGRSVNAVRDGTQLVLVKQGTRLYALSGRCSHLGGPLGEGEVKGTTITCPWHQSTFELKDGSVVRGPARCPQPAYEVRTRQAKIEVRLR